ncbi:MAG TPA: bifunctional oligoribonuclease/PAP phosphatase NrnA [Deltaproteobacteria bacterium]|nr:bifunctional oligoribonuclease/PAP phosphatase NrnA [Deltaproteobacteria bacterium]
MEGSEIADKLARLRELTAGKRKILILTHINPDPDAIASAYALRHLFKRWGVNSVIAYEGVIGRPENRAMMRRLRIPLRSIKTLDPRNFSVIAVVDAQPPSTHVPLSPSLTPTIVIDHHPVGKRSFLKKIPFVDIRPDLGSTSTIVASYLLEARVEITPMVATALFYGIKSDTRDLGRNASPEDVRVSNLLYQKISVKVLSEIENPRLPREYFRILKEGIQEALYFPPGLLVTDLGTLGYIDMIPVLADLLLRAEGIRWVLSIGEWKGTVFFSLRTTDGRRRNADKLAKKLVRGIPGGGAGGHETMAGGKVDLPSQEGGEGIRQRIKTRFLKELGSSWEKGILFVGGENGVKNRKAGVS